MLELAIVGGLFGSVLGMRFGVAVLLVAAAFAGLNTMFVALVLGATFSTALLGAIVVSAAVQFGFFFGSLTRFSVAASRSGQSMGLVNPASRLR